MSETHDIYAIRSATSPFVEPGATGEDLRAVADEGRLEIKQLGSQLMKVVGRSIHEVRFAPANRTRNTALGTIALTWSSVELSSDQNLTSTDPEYLRQYLQEITAGPTILFTHLDVIQSMVYSVKGERPDDELIPTASLTKFSNKSHGLSTEFVGLSINQAIDYAVRH